MENPSFESSKKCAYSIGMLTAVADNWNSPNMATPDFFNACSQGLNGIPNNFIGNQISFHGENYAGFYLLTNRNYREYVQGKLNDSLIKDKTYELQFHISLAESSDLALTEIGVTFTEGKIRSYNDKILTEKEMQKSKAGTISQHFIPIPKRDNYMYDWTKMRYVFRATGLEKFIIIGNFNSARKTKTITAGKPGTNISYYYLDQISLKEVSESEATEYVLNKQEMLKKLDSNETLILDDVNFDFDSDVLTESGKIAIEKFWNLIADYHRNILISGHTDAIGTDEYNLDISLKRAQRIADYLIEKGYNSEQISIEGCGENEPIDSNETDEGRSKNRRVEIRAID